MTEKDFNERDQWCINEGWFTKNEIFDLLKIAGFKNMAMENTFGYYSVITAIK